MNFKRATIVIDTIVCKNLYLMSGTQFEYYLDKESIQWDVTAPSMLWNYPELSADTELYTDVFVI